MTDQDGSCGCGGCGCGGDARPLTLEPPARPAAQDLDVRGLPCEQRRERVVAATGALVPGEALVVVNDHDPAGLRDLLARTYPGDLSWEYLERGPEAWRVMIGRESCC